MNKKKTLIAISLIAFGAITRLLLKDLPNVETITITALLAGSMLGWGYAIVVALSAMAITDVVIGNDSILLFTWSAFVIIGLLGVILRHKSKTGAKYILQMTGLGMGASVFFYLFTNFGVWLLWPQMYVHTWQGLVQCYVMGLPFLKYNMLGNLVIVPVVSSVVVFAPQWLKLYNRKKEYVKN
ncbi:hypothetical protein KKD19_04700 [Patescibacteria group bacterium]|nr:hypothetical protein [Patescibacteria group bacterium]MBU4512508.1 hypothetical protein [Patescibacteria group bacterium]MCG2693513.1 hypothetical protein [Candidatus Parcubacteria bacterium]